MAGGPYFVRIGWLQFLRELHFIEARAAGS